MKTAFFQKADVIRAPLLHLQQRGLFESCALNKPKGSTYVMIRRYEESTFDNMGRRAAGESEPCSAAGISEAVACAAGVALPERRMGVCHSEGRRRSSAGRNGGGCGAALCIRALGRNHSRAFFAGVRALGSGETAPPRGEAVVPQEVFLERCSRREGSDLRSPALWRGGSDGVGMAERTVCGKPRGRLLALYAVGGRLPAGGQQ